MGAQRSAAPVLSGVVPPLAESYLQRPETGAGLTDGLHPGETIVLARQESAGPDQATEGIGKTQLALGFAHAAWNAGAVDLLVWVPASSRESVIASYAQAAGELDADNPGEIADAAAKRFLGWLSRTRRRWALILDDLQAPADLEGLWPRGSTGQVVVTTRLPESELRAPERTVVGIEPYSRREGLAYLNARLTGYPDQRIECLDLAEDLGGVPISLSLAAAQIMDADITARDYRARYTERQQATAGAAIEGCSASLLANWSLAVEQAQQSAPDGLAWPTLAFTALLAGNGIPAAVLTSPAACGYIAGRPSDGGTADQNAVRAAFATLARLGLVSLDRASGVRTVWMHSAVQAAIRAYLPSAGVEQVVLAAASALLEAWPEPGAGAGGGALAAQLEQALRDCAASLREYAGDLLWKPEAHPLLLRAGVSLEDSLLASSAIDYWQSIASTCAHLVGPGHAQSVLARDRLATAYEKAGRMAEAMSVFEAALADRERNLGADHPETLIARVNLAHSYDAAGLEAQAIGLYEQTLAESERQLGAAHRDTLAVRASLAAALSAAGRRSDSVRLYERTLAESERALGTGHKETVAARLALAGAYQSVGQGKEAIGACQRALQDLESARGPDHLETISARAQLAGAYRHAGKQKDAIAAFERVLADRERVQGADHPDTMSARASLAFALRGAGKLKDAIPHYERVLADRERVLGPDHRDTLTARSNLAAAYQVARRLNEAIPTYERAVADSERMLGADDMETMTTRCNLATAFYDAGRMNDMVRVLRRALTDCEQFLGPDHQMTVMVRENLDSVTAR
ncbi:MAG TPA: tetratricopeptide repeat protein [Trebonia sp.]|nr:tetratricopeptide repeat protein [Trebonia sp.]